MFSHQINRKEKKMTYITPCNYASLAEVSQNVQLKDNYTKNKDLI